jgi:hypothetical protein
MLTAPRAMVARPDLRSSIRWYTDVGQRERATAEQFAESVRGNAEHQRAAGVEMLSLDINEVIAST